MSLETLLLYFFAAASLAGGVLMLVARHPMRVALALISSMISLAAIYAILGVHVIAVFQVLIYVGAVMVFMVYVIMLLDVRDPSFLERYGRAVVPSVAVAALLAVALGAAVSGGDIMSAERLAAMHQGGRTGASFEVQPFSVEFLERYWLHFELTSVLLLAAVVAAIAVIKAGRRHDG
jgi:NADH-quinone oxidoreductase subunit J